MTRSIANICRVNGVVSVSKNVLYAMIAIIVTILIVSIYANVQKVRRGRIEKATFTPAATAPSTAPAP